MRGMPSSAYCRALSVILSISLGVGPVLSGLQPQAALAAEDPAVSSTAPVSVVGELEDERTATTKVFELSDGSRRTSVAELPVHYQDDAGMMQDIVTALVPAETPGTYEVAANDLDIELGTDASGAPTVRVEGDGFSLGVDLAGETENVRVCVGNEATYLDVAPHASLGVEVRPDGFKQEVILASKEAPNSYSFDISLQGLELKMAPDGLPLLYREGQDEPAGDLGRLLVFDSSGVGSMGEVCTDAETTISKGPTGSPRITYTVPRSWLDDPARVFPVVVDPIATIYNIGGSPVRDCPDTFVCVGKPTTSYGSLNYLSAGYGTNKETYSFLKFDQSSVPSSAYIDAASLKVYQYMGATNLVRFGKITNSWSGSTIWNTKPSFSYLGAQTPGSSSAWLTQGCTGVVRDWRTGISTDHGLAVYENYGETGNHREFRSGDYGDTAFRPRLVIDWHTPAASVSGHAPSYQIGDTVTTTMTVVTPAASSLESMCLGLNRKGGVASRYRGYLGWFNTDPGSSWTKRLLPDGTYLAYHNGSTYGTDKIEPDLAKSRVTTMSGSKSVTFAFRISENFGDIQDNDFDTYFTMDAGAGDYVSGWQSQDTNVDVVTPVMSVEATAVGLGWFTGVDDDADGHFDNFADEGDGGRCAVTLDWDAVAGASSYDVQISDGATYRTVESIAATGAPVWTSAGKGFYPTDSMIATLVATPGWSGPFLDGTGLDLRDRPTALYRRIVGGGDSRQAYEFRVIARLANGASVNSSTSVTAPSRSVDASNLPVATLSYATAAADAKLTRPVIVFVGGFMNRQSEFSGNIANDEGQGIYFNPPGTIDFNSGDDGVWNAVISALKDDYDIIKVPAQWNSTDTYVVTVDGDLATNGERIYNYLRRHPELKRGGRYRKYIIVGYSMGGLVARAMLDGDKCASGDGWEFRTRCKRVMQVGTPNLGTPYLGKTMLSARGTLLLNPLYAPLAVNWFQAESQMRPGAMEKHFNKRFQNRAVYSLNGTKLSGVRYYDKYAGRAMKKHFSWGEWQWLGGDRVVERSSVWGPSHLKEYGAETTWDYAVHTTDHKGQKFWWGLGNIPHPDTSSITIVPGDKKAQSYLQSLVGNIDYYSGFARKKPIALSSQETPPGPIEVRHQLSSKEVTTAALLPATPQEFTADLVGPLEIYAMSPNLSVVVQDFAGEPVTVSFASTESATGSELDASALVEVTSPGEHTITLASDTTDTVVLEYADPDAPGLDHAVSSSVVTTDQSIAVTASVLASAGPVPQEWRLDCSLGESTVAMHDDGEGPDAIEGDGVYSGSLDAPDADGRYELVVSASPSLESTSVALVSGSTIHVVDALPEVGAASAAGLGQLRVDGIADAVCIDVPLRNPRSTEVTLGVEIEVSCDQSSTLTAVVSSGELVLQPGEERTVRIEAPAQDVFPLLASGSALRVDGVHLALPHLEEELWVEAPGATTGQALRFDTDELAYRSIDVDVSRPATGQVLVSGEALTTMGDVHTVEYSLDGGATWLDAMPEAGVFDTPSERFRAAFTVPDGAYEVLVRPADGSGSWDDFEWASAPLIVDTEPPALLAEAVSDAGGAAIQVNADDGASGDTAGVDVLQFRIDGGMSEQMTVTDARACEELIPVEESGIHIVEVRAIDRQGNVSEWVTQSIAVP